MRGNIRYLTRSAAAAALAAVLVYLSGVLPSGRLALSAVAGISALLILLECGGKWALGVYIVSAALSLLLTPSKAYALLYAAFLGYYPALKCVIERIKSRLFQWVVKLAVLNAVLSVLFFFLRAKFAEALEAVPSSLPLWLLWIGINIVFLVYDLGLLGLIRLYVRRFAGQRNGV